MLRIVMKIEGLKGCSDVHGHEGWIDIKTLQWGTGRGVSWPRSDDGPQERRISQPSVSEISLTRLADTASIELFKLTFATEPVSTATIRLVNERDSVVAEVTLTEVYLSGYSWNVAADRPTDNNDAESLSLNYATIRMSRTGAAESPMFDLAHGKLSR